VLISNLLFFYEYFTLLENNALTSEYDLKQSFPANLIVALAAGFTGGLVTVNLMDRWLRKNAFLTALFYIVVTYIVAAVIISAIGASYFYSEEYGLPLFDPKVLEACKTFFTTWFFIKQFIVWLIIVVGTLIVLMVNEKYGPGVFPDYLLGRYFMPKNERRIFMFADIKSATHIAEALGEEKYFNFLKDFFRDIAPAIVQSYGEVYQYVGDEVVLSWKMKQGMKSANAIRCFYDMKKLIEDKEATYLKKYGHIPTFKAGFHYGNVMVGELGQIKREIAFSGDVVNTTSRIQGLCNELGVEVLASEAFANLFFKLPKGVTRENLGGELLRGKALETALVTFRNKN
jgi:adenylate cyclase